MDSVHTVTCYAVLQVQALVLPGLLTGRLLAGVATPSRSKKRLPGMRSCLNSATGFLPAVTRVGSKGKADFAKRVSCPIWYWQGTQHSPALGRYQVASRIRTFGSCSLHCMFTQQEQHHSALPSQCPSSVLYMQAHLSATHSGVTSAGVGAAMALQVTTPLLL